MFATFLRNHKLRQLITTWRHFCYTLCKENCRGGSQSFNNGSEKRSLPTTFYIYAGNGMKHREVRTDVLDVSSVGRCLATDRHVERSID